MLSMSANAFAIISYLPRLVIDSQCV